MPRTTETITFSLPPTMVKEMQRWMEIEGRTKSELLREALRQYMEDRKWRQLYRYGEKQTRKMGIRPEQVEDVIDELRQ